MSIEESYKQLHHKYMSYDEYVTLLTTTASYDKHIKAKAEALVNLTPFEDLRDILINVIGYFDKDLYTNINIAAIAFVLPVTEDSFKQYDKPKIVNKKIEYLPRMNIPGLILSIRYLFKFGNVSIPLSRGILRTNNKAFDSAVIMDIGCKSGKPVSIKLTNSGIQVTGRTNITLVKETMNHLIKAIMMRQDELNAMRNDEEFMNYIDTYRGHDMRYFTQHPKFGNVMKSWFVSYDQSNYTQLFDIICSDIDLYTGSLKIKDVKYHLVKLGTELFVPLSYSKLLPILKTKFKIMNNKLKNNQNINIVYIDELKQKTIVKINKEGNIGLDGSNFGDDYRLPMMKVYNTVMQLIYKNFFQIVSNYDLYFKYNYYISRKKSIPIERQRMAIQQYFTPGLFLEDSDLYKEIILDNELDVNDNIFINNDDDDNDYYEDDDMY